jgi:hypothetical protein
MIKDSGITMKMARNLGEGGEKVGGLSECGRDDGKRRARHSHGEKESWRADGHVRACV